MDQWDNPEYLEVFDAAYTWRLMGDAEKYYENKKEDVGKLRDVLQHYRAMLPIVSDPGLVYDESRREQLERHRV